MDAEPHAPSHHHAHSAHHAHVHSRTGHVHEGHQHHAHKHDHAPVAAKNSREPSHLNLLALSGLQRLALVAPILATLILLGLWATQNG